MAFGLPVVSTPCGGLDEQVVWGQSGLRFEFGDARGLAGQLRTLLSDSNRRTEMGRQSRIAFELSLSCERMIEEYGRVILAALGEPRGRRHRAAKPICTRVA
jgi:glycosyltransferase involved in cell wall biosynthesis